MDLDFVESDIGKLQGLAIKVDRILREEISVQHFGFDFLEARVYNIKTVGVQGDNKTYGHPAEIALNGLREKDGTLYTEEELYKFLSKLSTRITNEVKDVVRVVYVTQFRDERKEVI